MQQLWQEYFCSWAKLAAHRNSAMETWENVTACEWPLEGNVALLTRLLWGNLIAFLSLLLLFDFLEEICKTLCSTF